MNDHDKNLIYKSIGTRIAQLQKIISETEMKDVKISSENEIKELVELIETIKKM